MSGLLSYSGLTTKIRAMQSHLLNDQNFREIVELESVPQAVSYLKQHKGYEDLFEGYNLRSTLNDTKCPLSKNA